MNDAIIVNYDPFAMESRVTLIKDEHKEQIGVASDLAGLAATLIGLAYGKNIYSIKVHAPNAILDQVAAEIKENEQTIYSKNQIKVEAII